MYKFSGFYQGVWSFSVSNVSSACMLRIYEDNSYISVNQGFTSFGGLDYQAPIPTIGSYDDGI
jgi:hypothetical protein